jgi:hypothetical protein
MADYIEVVEERSFIQVDEQTTLVVVEETGAYLITIAGQGPAGVDGDKNYVFPLNGETDVTVSHGLGKYPSITIFDSSGNEVQGDYQHLTTNSTRLVFSAGFSGNAIFN